jgi:hypothetical protein
MPPVLFLTFLAAAGVAGYRIWSSLLGHAETARRKTTGRVRRAAAPVRDLGSLEWDEGAGVYRPRVRRDN